MQQTLGWRLNQAGLTHAYRSRRRAFYIGCFAQRKDATNQEKPALLRAFCFQKVLQNKQYTDIVRLL